MMRVDDRARADIALTAERTYYRFATDSSIEDGDLSPIEDFDSTVAQIVEGAKALEGEKNLSDEVKVQIFINNRLDSNTISEQSLRRIVNALEPLAAEFAFLRGFLA